MAASGGKNVASQVARALVQPLCLPARAEAYGAGLESDEEPIDLRSVDVGGRVWHSGGVWFRSPLLCKKSGVKWRLIRDHCER